MLSLSLLVFFTLVGFLILSIINARNIYRAYLLFSFVIMVFLFLFINDRSKPLVYEK